MEMLIAKLEEERAGLRQQIQSELEAQLVQMQNMMAANMSQAEQERQAFIRENQGLEERFLAMQKSNEDSLRVIKDMSELIAKHEREKKELRANVEKITRDEMEGLLEEMSNKHYEEVKALLEKADDQLEGMKKIKVPSGDQEKEETCSKNLDELPQLINSRTEMVGNLQQKIADTQHEQEELEKPSSMKKGLKIFAKLAPMVGQVAAAVRPETAAFAVPVGSAVGAVAEELSNECSIM